jgi:hypothetical protein
MNIDRSNYEIWLIDWLDGNLNEVRTEQLRNFLIENPDLKDESDELSAFSLNPAAYIFRDKNQLKKTGADMYSSQFEFLSVGYLENDLSMEQISELEETISLDPERKKVFDLIQKMKLSPAVLHYKKKNSLFKRSFAQKAVRFSFIGLSAAAIVAFALISYFSKPGLPAIRSVRTAQILPVITRPTPNNAQSVANKTRAAASRGKQYKNVMSPGKPVLVSHTTEERLIPPDSLVRSFPLSDAIPVRIPATSTLKITEELPGKSLVALYLSAPVNDYDEDRPKVSKFIAKFLREKILKEKPAKDKPLNFYEIAEAGVTELNKLFGWEMALDERKGNNGELKSIYFSSRMIKFNAPVKKSESGQ